MIFNFNSFSRQSFIKTGSISLGVIHNADIQNMESWEIEQLNFQEKWTYLDSKYNIAKAVVFLADPLQLGQPQIYTCPSVGQCVRGW